MEARISRAEWNRALDENLTVILDAIRGTDIEEVEVEFGDELIRVRVAPEMSRTGDGADPGASAEGAAGPVEVQSDRVGTFFRAKEDGEEALANEGDVVAVGDAIGYIDSLQVHHALAAPKSGRLVRFAVTDGEDVEYGELIAVIEEDTGADAG